MFKRKKYIRMTSLILVFVVMMNSSLVSLGASNLQYYTGEESVMRVDRGGDNSQEKAESLGREKSVEGERATYSYTFDKDEKNSNVAEVSAQIFLSLENIVIPIQVKGVVRSYPILENCLLWEGPLDGFSTYAGEEYKVVVGFAKLEGAQAVQMSITFQEGPLGLETYCFGSVITPEIDCAISNWNRLQTNDHKMELKSNIDGVDMMMATEEAFSLPSHFVLLKTAYGWISTEEFSGPGQRARLYFSENSDLAAVTFTTYAQNLRDMYDNNNIYVSQLSISLSTDEIDEYLGDFSVIEDIWIDIEQENQGVTGLLIDIFMDALSLLQIPTSFIQSCLENVMGCVTKNVEMFEANVNVVFPLGQTVDFDGTNYPGLPLLVRLDVPDPEVYVGYSPYYFTTSVRYRMGETIGTVNPTVIYTYIDAADASSFAYITVD